MWVRWCQSEPGGSQRTLYRSLPYTHLISARSTISHRTAAVIVVTGVGYIYPSSPYVQALLCAMVYVLRATLRAASIAVGVMDATVYGGAVGSRTGSLEKLDWIANVVSSFASLYDDESSLVDVSPYYSNGVSGLRSDCHVGFIMRENKPHIV